MITVRAQESGVAAKMRVQGAAEYGRRRQVRDRGNVAHGESVASGSWRNQAAAACERGQTMRNRDEALYVDVRR
jgi:hypothetical protein